MTKKIHLKTQREMGQTEFTITKLDNLLSVKSTSANNGARMLKHGDGLIGYVGVGGWLNESDVQRVLDDQKLTGIDVTII